MMVNDEVWSELMTYRPVWVRSRPIIRFPVWVPHYVAVVHPTDQPIRPAGMEGTSLVWDSESVCVPTDHS